METTVEAEEDIFDVANRVYGHPLGVHWLIDDNDLSGIDAAVMAGQKLKIRDSIIELVPIKAIQFVPSLFPDYLIDKYQSIFDVAMEKHGSIEGVYDMVEENGYDGVTEYLWELRPLKILSAPYNSRVKVLLADFMPVATIDEGDKSDGIGFMYIETNFIVR